MTAPALSRAAELSLFQAVELTSAASRAMLDALQGTRPYDSGTVMLTLLGAMKHAIDADPTIDRSDPATVDIIAMLTPGPLRLARPPRLRPTARRAGA